MVSYEYEVVYEGFCDPYTSDCYEYCEDDECAEPIHYTLVYKQAKELRDVCGELDVLSCDAASSCGANEVGCQIEYCDTTESEHECELLELSESNI